MDKYPLSIAKNLGWDERIIACHCGELVTCFIVVTERYVIIVDTMINPQSASFMLDIAGQYGNGRQLLVINTHADWDHCWGNQLFVGPTAVYPAPIIATRRCAERFHAPEASVFVSEMQAKEPELYDDVVLTPPTILFDDYMLISGGDLTLRMFATPGHQPDHFSIYIPEIQTLLAGDAAELPFPYPGTASSLPQLRSSLAQMKSTNPQVALYCHAPLDSGPELIQRNVAYFNLLEQKCNDAMDIGVPALPTEFDDVSALVDFPVREAFPAMKQIPNNYPDGHNIQIRMMLEYLGALRGN